MVPIWIILVLVVGVLVLAAIGVVVWLIARKPSGDDPSLMACGACGYSVRGVGTTACPECGADLREVGIVRPTARGGGAVWWVVLVVAVCFAAIVLLFCMGGMFFARGSATTTRTVTAPPPAQTQTATPTIEEGPAPSQPDTPDGP